MVTQEAMEDTLRSDKAMPLLEKATDRFAEVTISGAYLRECTYIKLCACMALPPRLGTVRIQLSAINGWALCIPLRTQLLF